jgi:hypothetical protein
MQLLGAHKAALLPMYMSITFNVRTIKQLSSTCAGAFTCAIDLCEGGLL